MYDTHLFLTIKYVSNV